VGQHGAHEAGVEADPAHFALHRSKIACQQRPVSLVGGAQAQLARLDLHGAVAERLAEHDGDLAGGGQILQQLARLIARQEYGDLCAIARNAAAYGAHHARAQGGIA